MIKISKCCAPIFSRNGSRIEHIIQQDMYLEHLRSIYSHKKKGYALFLMILNITTVIITSVTITINIFIEKIMEKKSWQSNLIGV